VETVVAGVARTKCPLLSWSDIVGNAELGLWGWDDPVHLTPVGYQKVTEAILGRLGAGEDGERPKKHQRLDSIVPPCLLLKSGQFQHSLAGLAAGQHAAGVGEDAADAAQVAAERAFAAQASWIGLGLAPGRWRGSRAWALY